MFHRPVYSPKHARPAAQSTTRSNKVIKITPPIAESMAETSNGNGLEAA
jgi:hypothetical protein